jgi:hypothetical protein
MLRFPRFFTATALLGLCALAPAQQPGTVAPPLQIDKTWNDAPASWDDLSGKVVVLDFAQTW